MFFPTHGLHRRKNTFSPEITGGETFIPVPVNMDSGGTILILGNIENSLPLTINAIDSTEIITSPLFAQVPLTLTS